MSPLFPTRGAKKNSPTLHINTFKPMKIIDENLKMNYIDVDFYDIVLMS
jgi:hypothetical protein